MTTNVGFPSRVAPGCVPSEIEVHYGPANRGGLQWLVLIVEGCENREFELRGLNA